MPIKHFPRAIGSGGSIWNTMPKGSWRYARREEGLGANFRCPNCGMIAGLGPGTNHDIASSGEVTPSVVCDGFLKSSVHPDGVACSFHEWVWLDDWDASHTDKPLVAPEDK